ncbi:Hypothetical protein CINCED_3A002988 [Cinara cedri]|uniref:Uncharacterized protein n=1 Tax=Cinara cedri TaxID=506608 RepID=A0A5E4NDE6_9HEMI|nr:Hypothetical protein CINCED_3A002988 [Cinara cedri]
METASFKTGGSPHKDYSNEKTNNHDEKMKIFNCIICFNEANKPCLHKRLKTISSRQVFPMCNAHISKDKVTLIDLLKTTKQNLRIKRLPRLADHRRQHFLFDLIANLAFSFFSIFKIALV